MNSRIVSVTVKARAMCALFYIDASIIATQSYNITHDKHWLFSIHIAHVTGDTFNLLCLIGNLSGTR